MITKTIVISLIFNICSIFAQNISGSEIITQMFNKWSGKWYKNFTFEQNVYYYKDNKIIKEDIWQEVISSPANLHIRINGFETNDGMIFRNDSIYYFSKGEITKKEHRVHHLLLLGFDVYFYQPIETIQKLKTLGFDLSKTYENQWQSRDVYVVGTENESDLNTSQFWIDKERLYLVRVMLNTNGIVREVEMNNYTLIENNWVATDIVFKTNNVVTMVEKYFNIKFPKYIDGSIFDISRFKDSKW